MLFKGMQTLRNLRRGHVQGLVVVGLVLAAVAFVFPTETSAQKVLVSGGAVSTSVSTNTAEVYDPATATWTPTANAIPNPPPNSLGGLCAPNVTLLGNNLVLWLAEDARIKVSPRMRQAFTILPRTSGQLRRL